ncbi:MAG TPA: peroxiredoxin [Elusimicrobiota bacterium]|nr:peroxiredoxin [Elusimicrobiota bacterium]
MSIPRGGLWALCFAVAGTAPGLVDATTKEISMTLQVGDTAPDFTAATDGSQPLTLSTFLATNGKGKTVVLYFYPKDDTPGCTVEACAFRDRQADFGQKNAVVLGVSLDGGESHRSFKTKFGLPFTLISDVDGNLSRAYGVFNEAKGRSARWTFVIGPDRRIRKIFPNVAVEGHAAEVLSAL